MHNFINYLKVSVRNLYREKLYALINLAGLSLAIACCLILGLYLRSELSYDQHFEKHDQIYRLVNEMNANGNTEAVAVTSPVVAPKLANDFNEEIITFTRMWSNPSILINYEEASYYWESSYFVDNNFFDIFSHNIIHGNPENALDDFGSVAVSRSLAERYFGDENPIGKVLSIDSGVPLTITLVYEDLPENTHVKYDMLSSIDARLADFPDNPMIQRQLLWQLNVFTYLVMPSDYEIDSFTSLGEDFYERNMKEFGEAQGVSLRFWLEPLDDIHLKSDLLGDEPSGSLLYLYAFAAVAIFILVVACINYTNLATARAMKHSKTVGMRKILGASRRALMMQFLTEAIVFALISTIVGIAIVEVVLELSSIHILLGKPLAFSFMNEPEILAWLLTFSMCIGLIAGFYPAIYLSSWAPVSALVSSSTGSAGNVRMRQGLVLVQFIISISVIASTLLMASQMQFISEKSLGFDKENRISIRLVGVDMIKKASLIKNELLQHQNILGIAAHEQNLGQQMGIGIIAVENNDGAMEQVNTTVLGTDLDYFDVMGIKLLEGRDFSQRLLTDIGSSIIINEAMARKLGWTEALGKKIADGRVIGVVEDFHYESLHKLVEPLIMSPFNDNWDQVAENVAAFQQRYITINIAREEIRETLSYIEERFAEFDPQHPFEFKFLDESLDELYQSESRLMQLIAVFSGICIFVSCMGLFGLASYTTEQRNKEIGIRKVLGANTWQIILILSRQILSLILVGAVLASLFSYLIIDEWLTNFAYRADINPAIFIVATISALLIALVTVALQSFKTAQADPVNVLRHE